MVNLVVERVSTGVVVTMQITLNDEGATVACVVKNVKTSGKVSQLKATSNVEDNGSINVINIELRSVEVVWATRQLHHVDNAL